MTILEQIEELKRELKERAAALAGVSEKQVTIELHIANLPMIAKVCQEAVGLGWERDRHPSSGSWSMEDGGGIYDSIELGGYCTEAEWDGDYRLFANNAITGSKLKTRGWEFTGEHVGMAKVIRRVK